MNPTHNTEPSVLVESSNIDLTASTKAFWECSGRYNGPWITAAASLSPLAASQACRRGLVPLTSIHCSSEEKEKSSRCYGLFPGVHIDGLKTERETHREAQVTGRICVSASILEADTVGLISEVLSRVWCEEKIHLKPSFSTSLWCFAHNME